MANQIDTKLCPFCKQDNQCDAENEAGCWCNRYKIPQALIDLVPTHLKRKSCICSTCVARFNQNPEQFIHSQ